MPRRLRKTTTARSRPRNTSSLSRRNTPRPPRPVRPAVSAISPSPTYTTRLEARSSARHAEGGSTETFEGGSRLGRVLKAFVFGTVAALAGGALYYAIVRTTGYNIGLISVLVGYMVGRAVRAGSANRGGLFYQFLAVFLTYSSIVAMHIPFLVEQELERVPQKDEPAKVAQAKVDADGAKAKDKDLAKEKDKAALHAEEAPRQDGPPMSGAQLLVLAVRLIGFLYSIPVQLAIAAPISGLIFGFALWQAWIMTRKVRLSFNGPFRVAMGPLNVPMPEDFDHGG